ncbi:hypothetical protein E8E13_007023 [Curvularia kusanoi]|uniref:Uncharacterized protein n=1 Tax=Curvularia kusanoi TaxID=90978 RepID=A0A9P4W717_CURKU|nr:hypothetical protein E8E13_007023 [Curvularia kusanoi]
MRTASQYHAITLSATRFYPTSGTFSTEFGVLSKDAHGGDTLSMSPTIILIYDYFKYTQLPGYAHYRSTKPGRASARLILPPRKPRSSFTRELDKEFFLVCNEDPVKDEDVNLIDQINEFHHGDRVLDDTFHASGIYRKMLTTLLHRCPNLKTINVRKLKAVEHIPGWRGD